MFAAGFIIAAIAAWLADSAYKNRAPIETLKAVIQNPSDVRSSLASGTPISTGTGFKAGLITPQSLAGTTSGATTASGEGAGSAIAQQAMAYMKAQVGKPYGWGKIGPDSYDCSGLGYAAYKAAGLNIPRTTSGMIVAGKPVSKSQLQPGDAIFPYPGHVFWYAGGGQCVEAPHTGTTIRMTNIYQFFAARRFA